MVPVSCNDDGGEFGRSICEIKPKDFELKVEYQGDNTSFLNLDTTVEEGNLYM